MTDNMSISPAYDASRLCFFEGLAKNNSFALNATRLSTSVFIAILSPIAVVGNALVMTAIWKNPSLRTPSYICLCGLALTDLCTGLITQPFYVAAQLICFEPSHELKTQLSVWFLPYATAIAAGSGSYLNYLTLLLLTLISIERWLHMTRRSLLTVRRSCVIVVVIMVLSIPVVTLRLLNILKKTHGQASGTISFVILLVCVITTLFAYFKVVRIFRRHQQQVIANESLQNFGQSAINLVKYQKSVYSMLYISVLLVISFLPLLLLVGLSLLSSLNPFDLRLLFLLSTMFSFLSSSLNPMIYIWRMNDIRNGVKQLLMEVFCRNSSVESHQT